MMTETPVVDPYYSSHDLHKEAQRLNIQLDLITKSNIQLREELEQTSREKVQAAEYGLAVLEEKQVLQQMYDDLEVMYETTRQELDLARGVSCFILTNLYYLHDSKRVSFGTWISTRK